MLISSHTNKASQATIVTPAVESNLVCFVTLKAPHRAAPRRAFAAQQVDQSDENANVLL